MPIEEADLRGVCDRATLFALLENLGWRVSALDTYTYAYDGPALNADVAARAQVSQIVPFGGTDPFALLLVEFETTFRRGDLRDILQAVRADVRKRASYGGKTLDDIIFVCATESYGGVRFVHFESKDAARQPRLRVFGWDCDQTDGMRTLRDHNLTCLRLPRNVLDEPDWKTAEPAWRTAWDVERVTREFYTDYERVFKGVEQQVSGVQGDRRLWVQRLMNRLLFVQFLSKKKPAWLRFGERTDYLPALYERAVEQNENFYEDRLWWAFFCGLGTLSDDVDEHGHETLRERRGEVPFLNGGLFDRVDANDDRNSGVTIPNAAFKPVLDLFAQYNFTITESAPDDADVAVDPEMLGKVFERLVTGRHESGSYYTPRGIVTFMCRESLKQYLAGALNGNENGNGAAGGEDGESQAAIEAFVERRDASGLRRPEAVLGALRFITVCDPACGSGAYLLGMMQELLALRQSLFASKVQDFREVYDRKREIIQQNIYGADKDPFAVSIAMLRLWLSLTIEDRRDPHDTALPPARRDVSLPNLKFKVVVGDSLTAPDPSNLNLMGDAYSRDADTLRNCHNNYFTAHDGGTGAVGSKAKIEAQVRKAEASLSDLFGDMARPTNDDGSLRVVWHVAFAEVFAPRREAGDLGGGLNLGLTLAPPPTPGGFDIVLANPPYVRMELFKDIKPILKRVYRTVHAERADLYTYFYARAIQLLKPGGVLAFISPNKWFNAEYGSNLRRYIAEKCQVHSITDFGDLPVFENATAYPMVFIGQRGSGRSTSTFTHVKSLDPPYPDVLAVVRRDGSRLEEDAIQGSEWNIVHSSTAKRLKSFLQTGMTLEQYVNGQIFRGIVTGLNAAFVIEGATRKKIIAENSLAAKVIKRLVVGEDVRKWNIADKDRWLLYIDHGIDMENLNSVLTHLLPYRDALENRATKQAWYELQQPQARFAPFFERPKIMYPQIMIHPRFTLDFEGSYINQKCFIIPTDDLFLLAVLNSPTVWEMIVQGSPKLRGGYVEPRREFMLSLPIPNAPDAEKQAIAVLVQKCLDAKGVDCGAWEAEIDGRVAGLYGL